MTNRPPSDALSRLRAETDATLRALLRIASSPASATNPSPSAERRGPHDSTAPILTTRTATSALMGDTTVNVNLMGGTIVLDDERTIRALAKQIKRLITEDRRRGLGVGG